jgi:hypothetical protein
MSIKLNKDIFEKHKSVGQTHLGIMSDGLFCLNKIYWVDTEKLRPLSLSS